jgi:hypothetical protein
MVCNTIGHLFGFRTSTSHSIGAWWIVPGQVLKHSERPHESVNYYSHESYHHWAILPKKAPKVTEVISVATPSQLCRYLVATWSLEFSALKITNSWTCLVVFQEVRGREWWVGKQLFKLRCECARDYCHGSLLHKQTNKQTNKFTLPTNKQIYIANKQTNLHCKQTNRVSIANEQNQQDSTPPIITKMGSNVH